MFFPENPGPFERAQDLRPDALPRCLRRSGSEPPPGEGRRIAAARLVEPASVCIPKNNETYIYIYREPRNTCYDVPAGILVAEMCIFIIPTMNQSFETALWTLVTGDELPEV